MNFSVKTYTDLTWMFLMNTIWHVNWSWASSPAHHYWLSYLRQDQLSPGFFHLLPSLTDCQDDTSLNYPSWFIQCSKDSPGVDIEQDFIILPIKEHVGWSGATFLSRVRQSLFCLVAPWLPFFQLWEAV